MRRRTKLIALLGGVLVLLAAPAAVSAVPVPSPDPCDALVSGSWNTTKLQKWTDCRLDRIESAIPGNQTVTETVTVTAEPTSSSTAAPTTSATTTAPPAPGGWPNADNTGVPAGTNLTAYTGPLTITQDGTVIDSKTINGDLEISASDVTITRSVINGIVESTEAGTGFTLEDSEVRVGDRPGTAVGEVNFIVRRVEVTGGNRSMNCWKTCLIEDSWVHGQMSDETGVYHESGIRMGANGTIRHNTITCDAPVFPPDAGCSAGLTGYGDFAPVENMLIERNYFHASPNAAFCAYGGSSGSGGGKPFGDDARDIRFLDNVFERGTVPGDHGVPVCAAYGPISDFDPGRPGNVWSGNTWDDGAPLDPA